MILSYILCTDLCSLLFFLGVGWGWGGEYIPWLRRCWIFEEMQTVAEKKSLSRPLDIFFFPGNDFIMLFISNETTLQGNLKYHGRHHFVFCWNIKKKSKYYKFVRVISTYTKNTDTKLHLVSRVTLLTQVQPLPDFCYFQMLQELTIIA